ncbi:3-oxoacyl-ACP reductase [Rhodoferax sp. BAB1]|uniref:3-oxoacyl-ACP reductase n=1 Tax=Rhodoferax sp. BAB1 TaxID=2741720 RepID=UPI001576EE78|nr:3-oxoacyl-ACP reductase [Rhodoferax sp. BAB1]QKO22325.1 3-oxoacyl-ACP reductase [Rhodoferax sp. BAB1]
MDFAGKVILVTGASRGIGAAIAQAFAAEGGFVVVNYLRNEAAADAVVAQCKATGAARGGDAWAIRADVNDPAQVQALVVQVQAELGRIDVLVNNAFAPYRFDPEQRKRFWETGWTDYQTQFDGAVRATYNVCQAVLPGMRQRAQGCIVNLASDLVERPVVAYHDYATAKSALVGFSRNLAAELGPLGIRVNCVAPGLVYPTDASRATKEDVKEAIVAQTPLRRIARPEDVAGPVLFLASDWSRFVTGQVLVVDGGLVMK